MLLLEDTAPREGNLPRSITEADVTLEHRQVVVVEQCRLDLSGRVSLEGHSVHGLVDDYLLRICAVRLQFLRDLVQMARPHHPDASLDQANAIVTVVVEMLLSHLLIAALRDRQLNVVLADFLNFLWVVIFQALN